MTAKIPSGGLIWLFGLIYVLGYSCQLCQGLRRPEQQQNLLSWWDAHKRAPGSEFLGKRSSGPTGHELQELDKRVPGSEFLGKRVPGSEFFGKRVPGSEFLGKRNTMPSLTPEEEVELYNVMEDLTNQNALTNLKKRSLEVPLPYAQKTDRLHYELDTEDP